MLDKPIGTESKEFIRIKNGLSNKKGYVFTFLDDPDVSNKNNANEGVRPAKIKKGDGTVPHICRIIIMFLQNITIALDIYLYEIP